MFSLVFKTFLGLTPNYLSGLISQLPLLNQSRLWMLKQNPTLMSPNSKGTQRYL